MQKLDTERAEEADLQRRLGPVLDGMTDEDRRSLEERAIRNEQELALSRRSEALHRIRLLRHLAEKACLAAA